MSEMTIRGKILVVDDNAELLEEYKKALEAAGYSVTTARCVREALEKVDTAGPFVAVISDVIMEEKDSGFFLCYRLKRNPATKHVPVLLLSSTRRDAGTRFSLHSPGTKGWLQADDIVNKPVTPGELVLRVGRLLEDGHGISA